MLDGKGKAATSNRAVGVTFSSSKYERTIRGRPFHFFDTVGLGEGEEGTVPTRAAIQNLHRLISALDKGINLLVFVFRGRVQDTTLKNYQMFFQTFCQEKVPIVIVVTGLEREKDMNQWWIENKDAFDRQGMKFSDCACITTIKGREVNGAWTLQKRYDQSKLRLEDLIMKTYNTRPWKIGTIQWFRTILKGLLRNIRPKDSTAVLAQAFEENLGMSRRDAQKEAKLEIAGNKKQPVGPNRLRKIQQ